MTADPTGVWWDLNDLCFGWTCPRCQGTSSNHFSADSARFTFMAHFCPPLLEAEV